MYIVKLICEVLIVMEIIRKTILLIKNFDIRLILFIITQIIILIPFQNKFIYIINLIIYSCNDLIYDKKFIGVNCIINIALNILNVFAFMVLYLIVI